MTQDSWENKGNWRVRKKGWMITIILLNWIVSDRGKQDQFESFKCAVILGFHDNVVMTTKSPYIAGCHFFWLQKLIELGHVKVPNFWLSSHNFALLDGMAAPHKTHFIILEILKLWNYSYAITKNMTRNTKIGNLTNLTELYLYLESQKWYLLHDLLVKTINIQQITIDTSCPGLCCLSDNSCLFLFLSGCQMRQVQSPTEKSRGTDLLLRNG